MVGRDGLGLPFPVPPLVKVMVATALMATCLLFVTLQPGVLALATKIVLGVGVYGSSLFVLDIEGIRSQFPDHVQQLRNSFSGGRSPKT